MCVKEGLDDYRYFFELDIVLLYVDEDWKVCVREIILELLDECKVKYVNDFGLLEYDVYVLILIKEMFDFFEGVIDYGVDVKFIFNWLMGGVNEYFNKN